LWVFANVVSCAGDCGVRIRKLLASVAAVLLLALPGVVPAERADALPNLTQLQFGSTGDGVRCAQRAYQVTVNPYIVIDGDFGAVTWASTIDFQNYVGTYPDSIVGPETGDWVEFFDYDSGWTLCYWVVPTTW
jgi:peptidoglycan hydrolase-like protein with peptidoglycan-binding domain